jgi:hypothetical protein
MGVSRPHREDKPGAAEDEKSLKGKAIFNKLARRDVLTGLVPPPIELMWNCLTQRLKFFDLSSLNGTHRVVLAASKILNEITHDEIFRFYQKSGVFNLHGHKR